MKKKTKNKVGPPITRLEKTKLMNVRMGITCKRMLDGFCILTNRKQWDVVESALRRYIVTEGLRIKNNGRVGLSVLNDSDTSEV